jgi:hypothetical protein
VGFDFITASEKIHKFHIQYSTGGGGGGGCGSVSNTSEKLIYVDGGIKLPCKQKST